jgi:hypothetical protein
VYHSASVSQKPIVQVSLPSANNAALPVSITGKLTFNGTAGATVTYSTTGFAPGDVFTIALQASNAITTTGRYGYSVLVQVPGQSDQTITGAAYIVALDASVLGAGWSFAGVDQLVSIAADGNGPAGMLRVYGSGGYRFYEGTSSFTSPAGDNGTLSVSGGTTPHSTPSAGLSSTPRATRRQQAADTKESPVPLRRQQPATGITPSTGRWRRDVHQQRGGPGGQQPDDHADGPPRPHQGDQP